MGVTTTRDLDPGVGVLREGTDADQTVAQSPGPDPDQPHQSKTNHRMTEITPGQRRDQGPSQNHPPGQDPDHAVDKIGLHPSIHRISPSPSKANTKY